MRLTPTAIRTANLLLEPLSRKGAKAIVAGDLSAVRAGHGWPHADTTDGLRIALTNGHAPGWLVTLEGAVIGDCGVHGDPGEDGEVELGFGLAAPYRGLGYGSEMAAALSQWLLAQPGVSRVIGRVALANMPSRRTLERAGFERESVGALSAVYVLVDHKGTQTP
jgi:RimJ/RimL family protein N-acetyltransferase